MGLTKVFYGVRTYSLSFDAIFCQEHWLLTDQLFRLSDLVYGFRCVSVSAMDDVCSRGVLRGRGVCRI